MKGGVFPLVISAIVVSVMVGIRSIMVILRRKNQRLKESPDQCNQEYKKLREVFRAGYFTIATVIFLMFFSLSSPEAEQEATAALILILIAASVLLFFSFFPTYTPREAANEMASGWHKRLPFEITRLQELTNVLLRNYTDWSELERQPSNSHKMAIASYLSGTILPQLLYLHNELETETAAESRWSNRSSLSVQSHQVGNDAKLDSKVSAREEITARDVKIRPTSTAEDKDNQFKHLSPNEKRSLQKKIRSIWRQVMFRCKDRKTPDKTYIWEEKGMVYRFGPNEEEYIASHESRTSASVQRHSHITRLSEVSNELQVLVSQIFSSNDDEKIDVHIHRSEFDQLRSISSQLESLAGLSKAPQASCGRDVKVAASLQPLAIEEQASDSTTPESKDAAGPRSDGAQNDVEDAVDPVVVISIRSPERIEADDI